MEEYDSKTDLIFEIMKRRSIDQTFTLFSWMKKETEFGGNCGREREGRGEGTKRKRDLRDEVSRVAAKRSV